MDFQRRLRAEAHRIPHIPEKASGEIAIGEGQPPSTPEQIEVDAALKGARAE
jgi:hypothetical protein